MNMFVRNLGLAIVIFVTSTSAFSQKKNETSAAVENQRAGGAMAQGDIEGAKKALLSAKEFIDLAEVHVDTKERQKSLWLVGEIYSNLVVLGETTKDEELLKSLGGSTNAMAHAIAALKKGFPKGKKHAEDIIITVDRNRAIMSQMAGMMYSLEDYKGAAELYSGQAAFRECIQIMDTNALFNAALSYDYSKQFEKAVPFYLRLAQINYKGTKCFVYASASYRKAGQIDKAKALVAAAREKSPTDKDLLLEVVNTSIEEGDAAAAETALTGAIANDPNNKQLHYTIGTIMIDLGSGALAMYGDSIARSFDEKLALKEKSEMYYAKAETALNKALEIDPAYVDAQYQLGAHLVTWAGIIKTEASKLPYGDASYQMLEDKGEATYKRALVPLEKYIDAYPKDKAVLTILFQIERNLKNTEKALEYKKRADAIAD